MPTIRAATPADVPDLHALIERAYRGEPARAGWSHEADLIVGPRTDPATLAEVIDDPQRTILLAVEDERIVACIEVDDVGHSRAYLGQLAVEPGLQAGGLGRTMIAAGEDHARDLGATAIEMTVLDRRAELIAYYGRRGYAPTGEVRAFPYAKPASGKPFRLVVLAKAL